MFSMKVLKILNAGELELINYTGSDLMCVNAARASFGRQVSELGEKEIKLLGRLIKDGHLSTLEHTLFTFRVKCPIFVARQWMRHRTGVSYNERSGRYCKPEFEFYIPEMDIDRGVCSGVIDDMQRICQDSIDRYQDMVSKGCPKEVARALLPQGMYTNFYFTCNLRSFLHFYKLRSDSHAQEEIRVYANGMMELIKTIPEQPFKYTLQFINNA